MAEEKPLSPYAQDGFNFGHLNEPDNSFNYIPKACEKKYDGENNTWIILGRDRMGEEGYGKDKSGRCGAIDIVAGRMSHTKATTLNSKDSVNPSPIQDASRLYLSQKSDIDVLFSCPPGRSGKSQSGRSAAVLKSDDVRVIARNTLKLITRPEINLSNLGPNGSPILSTEIHGVELIGNALNEMDTELQPIPKGKNLLACIENMFKRLRETNAVLKDFMESQARINNYLVNHTHISAFPKDPTTPSPELISTMRNENSQMYFRIDQGLTKCTVNIVSTLNKFTRNGSANYINSAYHYLN